MTHKSFIVKALSVAFISFILFLCIFRLMQNPAIYNATLAKISHNYERVGTWDNYQILESKKPYTAVQSEKLLTWDASLYHCVSKYLYAKEKEDCAYAVRSAFFPLFPVAWRLSGLDALGISIFNFFLFAFSLLWLVILLIKDESQRLFYYVSGLLLPSVIVFAIPYSEAFFLAAMVISVAGLLNRKYWLYALGMFLVAASRPAAAFVPLAMLAVNFLYCIPAKNAFRKFFSDAFLLLIPYVLGLFAVIFMQYYYTGSWTAFKDAQKYWQPKIGLPNQISDWSVEGFGMSSFAIFFVALPCFIFLISAFILSFRKQKQSAETIFKADYQANSNFLFRTASFYIVGIICYTLLVGGGSTHSIFRFILGSPLFYILFLLLPRKIQHISHRKKMLSFCGLLFVLSTYLYLVEYGNERFQFVFLGMYLFIAFAALYLFHDKFPASIKLFSLVVLSLLSILWTTYLFNDMLSNGWIFT